MRVRAAPAAGAGVKVVCYLKVWGALSIDALRDYRARGWSVEARSEQAYTLAFRG